MVNWGRLVEEKCLRCSLDLLGPGKKILGGLQAVFFGGAYVLDYLLQFFFNAIDVAIDRGEDHI